MSKFLNRQMMRRTLCILIFLATVIYSESAAQNYIGMHKDEVIRLMGQNHKNFKLNKDVVNHAYKYLKFEDHISEQTMLFFLSDNDICTLVRWISDYSNINDILSMLNKKYSPAGKNKWIAVENGKGYLITLKEEEWFFSVTFKLKN